MGVSYSPSLATKIKATYEITSARNQYGNRQNLPAAFEIRINKMY